MDLRQRRARPLRHFTGSDRDASDPIPLCTLVRLGRDRGRGRCRHGGMPDDANDRHHRRAHAGPDRPFRRLLAHDLQVYGAKYRADPSNVEAALRYGQLCVQPDRVRRRSKGEEEGGRGREGREGKRRREEGGGGKGEGGVGRGGGGGGSRKAGERGKGGEGGGGGGWRDLCWGPPSSVRLHASLAVAQRGLDIGRIGAIFRAVDLKIVLPVGVGTVGRGQRERAGGGGRLHRLASRRGGSDRGHDRGRGEQACKAGSGRTHLDRYR